jgi:putative toxin-antitoxin system antitoxin component (TIGR02293 family)
MNEGLDLEVTMQNDRHKPRSKVVKQPASPVTAGLGVAQEYAAYGPVSAFSGDPSDIIRKMRSGTPAQIVPGLAARLGITQDGLFRLLRLPHSTMKARISKNDTLSASEQDRLYRTEKVLARTLAVLEDASSAKAWLVQENRSLGGEAPLSMLDTEAGYELVLDTLGRIEYGIVA